MAPALIVTIVRHGETEENRLRMVQGQLDTKLSTAGQQQAAMVAAALAVPEVPFSHAFSSDLGRSVEVCSRFEFQVEWFLTFTVRPQMLSCVTIPISGSRSKNSLEKG